MSSRWANIPIWPTLGNIYGRWSHYNLYTPQNNVDVALFYRYNLLERFEFVSY